MSLYIVIVGQKAHQYTRYKNNDKVFHTAYNFSTNCQWVACKVSLKMIVQRNESYNPFS